MGTPKNVYRGEPEKIPVAEIVRSFAVAQNVARFCTEEKREAALEQLRRWLEPMIEWLDKPVGDLLYSREERKSVGSKTRVVILFQLPSRNSGFSAWFGMNRDGEWLVMERNYTTGTWKFIPMDGETLERMIWTWRENFLGAEVGRVQKLFDEVMKGESDLRFFTRHACFLGFIRVVVESLNRLLEEREERLRTLRKNLEEIYRFGVALDPLSYSGDHVLPAYSLFYTRPGHTSRTSSSYLVRERVERMLAEEEARRAERQPSRQPDPYEGKEIIYDDSFRISSSHDLLSRIGHLLKDSVQNANSGCGREAFDDKEVKALEEFVRAACSFV